jgi:quercetin dioxygenase-like cupin family protein
MNTATPPLPPFASLRDEAPAFWSQDILWIFHATPETTGGAWSLIEELCPKGSGAPPHVHEWSDETFYVIDGAITFLAGDRQILVEGGGFISIPKGTIHGFRVDSDVSRVLNTYVPASWEAAVMALGVPAPRRELPPRGLPRPDPVKSREMMARYGMRPIAMPDPLRPNGSGDDQ